MSASSSSHSQAGIDRPRDQIIWNSLQHSDFGYCLVHMKVVDYQVTIQETRWHRRDDSNGKRSIELQERSAANAAPPFCHYQDPCHAGIHFDDTHPLPPFTYCTMPVAVRSMAVSLHLPGMSVRLARPASA